MDDSWRQFWHRTWNLFVTYIWPPLHDAFLAVFWFFYASFYHIGGIWGVVIGGAVLLIIGGKLSGGYVPGSGQVDSSGHVTIYGTGFYQKPLIEHAFFIYLGKLGMLFGCSLLLYLLYVYISNKLSSM